MKILLKTWVQDEAVDDANCLLLDLNEEAVQELLNRRELFRMVQSKDKGIHALAFCGIPGEFYDTADDELIDYLGDKASKFETHEYVVIDEDCTSFFNPTQDDDEEDAGDIWAVHTEVDQMLITEEGVYFRAELYDTASAYVESGVLPFEVLLEKNDGR